MIYQNSTQRRVIDSVEHQVSTHFDKENCLRLQRAQLHLLCLELQQCLSLVLSYKKNNSVGDTEVKATMKQAADKTCVNRQHLDVQHLLLKDFYYF